MNLKYKKFNKYIKRRYRFDVGYQVILSCKGFRLKCSQKSEKHSEKMKIIQKDKKWHKKLYDFRHRIKQKEQRWNRYKFKK